MINKQVLIELGFTELPHLILGSTFIYELSRSRTLSLSGIGTPNEMMFLEQHDYNDYKVIDDLVCVHNYDYDKYLTIKKLNYLIEYFEKNWNEDE